MLLPPPTAPPIASAGAAIRSTGPRFTTTPMLETGTKSNGMCEMSAMLDMADFPDFGRVTKKRTFFPSSSAN